MSDWRQNEEDFCFGGIPIPFTPQQYFLGISIDLKITFRVNVKKSVSKDFSKTDTFYSAYTYLPNTCGRLKTFAHRCSTKKVYFKILQNSKENTCAGVSFFNLPRT